MTEQYEHRRTRVFLRKVEEGEKTLDDLQALKIGYGQDAITMHSVQHCDETPITTLIAMNYASICEAIGILQGEQKHDV